jgi:hypothetical protein
MKKIILILFMIVFFLSGKSFAEDRGRYESSPHKFRSQFNDNEWREHEARSEEYFRARHPESYLYRKDGYNHRQKRDYYRYNGSLKYGRDDDHRYKYDWRDDSDQYDWDDKYDWQDDSDWEDWDDDEYRDEDRHRWD